VKDKFTNREVSVSWIFVNVWLSETTANIYTIINHKIKHYKEKTAKYLEAIALHFALFISNGVQPTLNFTFTW